MIQPLRLADEGRSRPILFASAALAFAGLLLGLAATTPGPRDLAVRPKEAAPPERPSRELAAATLPGPDLDRAPQRPSRTTEEDEVEARAPAVDPSRRGEREHYEHFLDLARNEGGLAELAETVLSGDRPDLEKVALLRALQDTDAEEATRWFGWVLRELPDTSGSPWAASVPAFVVRTLSEEARRDATARGLLREATWGPAGGMSPALRRRAAAVVAACAKEEELARLASDLAGEQDDLVRQGVLAALRRNADPRAVARHFGPLEPEPGSTTTGRDG